MAEAAKKETAPAAEAAPKSSGGGKSPIVLMALVVVNMIVVGVVGFMVYQGRKKEAANPTIENVVQGESETQKAEKEAIPEPGRIVPLETFIFNIQGARGRRIAKVNMQFEVDSAAVQEEIDKKKAQIRDIVIITLSSKGFEEISSRDGKEAIRSEIQDTVNAFLTKGKVTKIFFTEFVYN